MSKHIRTRRGAGVSLFLYVGVAICNFRGAVEGKGGEKGGGRDGGQKGDRNGEVEMEPRNGKERSRDCARLVAAPVTDDF